MTNTIAKSLGRAVLDLDRRAEEAVRPVARSRLAGPLHLFGEIGDQPPLLTLSAGVLAYGLARGDARLAKAGGHMIASHLLATFAKNIVKRRIDRIRPFVRDGNRTHKPRAGRSDSKELTSFPSGHSAGLIAVARAFGRSYPDHRFAALGAGSLVAAAQVPRLAHYPTDIAAFVVIGWASEAATNGAARLAVRLLRAWPGSAGGAAHRQDSRIAQDGGRN